MQPAVTRFGYATVVLSRMKEDKAAIKTLFANTAHTAWLADSGTGGGSRYLDLYNELNDDVVNQSSFWKSVDTVLAVLMPLYDALRTLDADAPCMTIAAMTVHRAMEAVCQLKDRGIMSEDDFDAVTDVFYTTPCGVSNTEGRWDYIIKDVHRGAAAANPQYHPTHGTGEVIPAAWAAATLETMKLWFQGDADKAADCFLQYGQFKRSEGYAQAAWDLAKKSFQPDENGEVPKNAMTLHEWHRLFSCHLPLFQDFASGMAAAYCCTSTGERLHKETSIVHTKLRNSLKHSTTTKLAHLHMHLRLKVRAQLGVRTTVLKWAASKNTAMLREARRLAEDAAEANGVQPLGLAGTFTGLLML
jgi:hypothetical protein